MVSAPTTMPLLPLIVPLSLRCHSSKAIPTLLGFCHHPLSQCSSCTLLLVAAGALLVSVVGVVAGASSVLPQPIVAVTAPAINTIWVVCLIVFMAIFMRVLWGEFTIIILSSPFVITTYIL